MLPNKTEQTSVLKQRVGLDLDDIFEGYAFRRKEGDLFIFGNDDHEVSFTLDVVRRSLQQKLNEDRVTELQRQLKALRVSRQSFALPHLTLSAQPPIEYQIVRVEEESKYIWLRALSGDERRVHVSTLHELQAHTIVADLKRLEADFDSLPLDFILLRVDELHEDLQSQAELSQAALGASLTSMRIRGLLAERIAERSDELNELEEGNLRRLSDELERGLKGVEMSQTRVAHTLLAQRVRVEKRRALLRELSCLERVTEVELVGLFAPDELRSRLIRLSSRSGDLSERLSSLAHEWYDRVHALTSLSFKRSLPDSLTIDSFVSMIFDLQDRYLNSQLRIGRDDLHLINRFQVNAGSPKLTYPVLRDYQETTRSERLALHRELYEHRLNLLFFNQIQDPALRRLAEYNVNDFYSLLYKVIS